MSTTTLLSSIISAIITGIVSYLVAVSKNKAELEALRISHKNEIEKLTLTHKIEIEKLKAHADLNSNNLMNEDVAKIIPDIFGKLLTGELTVDQIKYIENNFKK